MSEILEATMMICFGSSWPISAYKSIKAGTAKATSLPFLLLILVGYMAGVASKLCTHNYNYVLAIYVINLCSVTVNIVIYFINARRDRIAARAEQTA